MMKVLCTSVDHLPATLKDGERAFTLFRSAKVSVAPVPS